MPIGRVEIGGDAQSAFPLCSLPSFEFSFPSFPSFDSLGFFPHSHLDLYRISKMGPNWRQEQWVHAAAQIGIPIHPIAASATDPETAYPHPWLSGNGTALTSFPGPHFLFVNDQGHRRAHSGRCDKFFGISGRRQCVVSTRISSSLL